MKKVLYIVNSYPQLSQTYIQIEMEALIKLGYDVKIIAMMKPNCPTSKFLPYETISDTNEIIEFAKTYKTDVIHTHWIFNRLPHIYKVAKTLNIPFTIRSHSMDVLWRNDRILYKIRSYFRNIKYKKIINDPLCKGVLAFPFSRDLLTKSGINNEKIVDVFPVIDFEKFYNTEKNGNRVINIGAAIRKKNFKDFVLLAEMNSNIDFDLFPIGFDKSAIKEYNEQKGNPVNIKDEVPHDDMPAIYKHSSWLVYTAETKYPKVGWPVVSLEAMASGTGVCLPNIRPDMKDYISDAGIIYDNIDELKEIISKPVPNHIREKGFKLAEKYDIKNQIHLLTNLWE